MTALFVVRHPQTTWNVAGRYQGRLDAPLSEEGRAQAKVVARAFSGQRLDAVYSSPLSRAQDLARTIANEVGAPLLLDARLTEIAMGPWEGLYRADIEKRFADLYHEWHAHPQNVRFPSGESLDDVAARVNGFLTDLFCHHPDGNLAVVTHSIVVRMLAALALGLDFANIHRLPTSNGAITTICGTGPPGSLLSLNVTDHLHGSPVEAAAAQNCVSWKERRMTV